MPTQALPEASPDEDFAGQTFESPCLRFTVDVVFEGIPPAQAWSYDKLSRIERPGEPSAQSVLQTKGAVGAEFFDLYGGLCAGIAWRY